MSKGYMYILECSDGSFYTGSTKDIDKRMLEHEAGEGSNYTSKRLPVKLIYFEEFDETFTLQLSKKFSWACQFRRVLQRLIFRSNIEKDS